MSAAIEEKVVDGNERSEIVVDGKNKKKEKREKQKARKEVSQKEQRVFQKNVRGLGLTEQDFEKLSEQIMMLRKGQRELIVNYEMETGNLRKAIFKLKLENIRMKEKVKTLQESIKNKDTDDPSEDEFDVDYTDLKREDMLLIDGFKDPLSPRYESETPIVDKEGIEHKSAERFCLYKMAEHFGDKEAMEKITKAPTLNEASDAITNIKGFDPKAWDKIKLNRWEEALRLKFTQSRLAENMLVLSGASYLAVASPDKFWGIGWRKHRDEAGKAYLWVGKNEGGKLLMKLRQELKKKHAWKDENEEKEAQAKFDDLKAFEWRRRYGSGRSIRNARSG